MNGDRLILVGGGAFGREIINWALDARSFSNFSGVSGFLDVSPDVLKDFSYEVEYLGNIEQYSPREAEKFVIGIGDPVKKRKIVELLKSKGAQFATLIHPSAVIARSAILGEGVVVCPNSFVSADARVGNFVAINGLSSVGHDVDLGSYSTLSAHVDLTGWVKVGEECFFGTGAKIMPKVVIGRNSKIGAGSLIMRDVKPETIMYTMPAKKFK
jgi:sugar O-acyltransferase (sialic acid O-acetyltransferase NeuD family)